MDNVNFEGASFTPVFSHINIDGTEDQLINLANLSVYYININNTGGTVRFVDGFNAAEFRTETTTANVNMKFKEGATYKVRNLYLHGSGATQNIALSSLLPGSKWNFNISGHRSVRGVDVSDCDASTGLLIIASGSKDSGGNINWDFSQDLKVWIGSNNNFHTANNWSPSGVPDASSRILIDTPASIIINQELELRDLVLGGGAGTSTLVVNKEISVKENIVVLNNGILQLNKPTVVENDFYVQDGGLVNHAGPQQTEANKVDLTILGDLVVDKDGSIDLTGSGFSNTYGPGCPTVDGSGSYGGLGSKGGGDYGVCYGSVIAPVNIGSGGRGNTAKPGGGAFLAKVTGSATVDGKIMVDGTHEMNRPGSGGSINLITSYLYGYGMISSMGGSGYTGGGGGRIAILLSGVDSSFSDFYGTFRACGGIGSYSRGGAGTIYLETHGDGAGFGKVIIDNYNINGELPTLFPPSDAPEDETINAVFHVSNGAVMSLTQDYAVGDIWLASENAYLDLNGKTLRVDAEEHDLPPGSVRGDGEILWRQSSTGTIFKIK